VSELLLCHPGGFFGAFGIIWVLSMNSMKNKSKWAEIKIGAVRKINRVCPHPANLLEWASEKL